MAVPIAAIAAIVEAGHPDDAVVGVTVRLLREILHGLPVAVVGAAPTNPTAIARIDGEPA